MFESYVDKVVPAVVGVLLTSVSILGDVVSDGEGVILLRSEPCDSADGR